MVKADQVKKAVDLYDEIASSYALNIKQRVPHEALNLFVSLLPIGSTVLDIGCAAGRDTRLLKDAGMNVVGLDLSEKLLEIAKQENPHVKFMKADMRHLPFEDTTIQGIWANAVFHHLPKQQMFSTLKEWKRVLTPSGICYIRTKKGKGLLVQQDHLSSGHVREFTLLSEEELHSMLHSLDFQKVKMYTKKDATRDIQWIFAFYKKK